MSLDITIRRPGGGPLGTNEEVRRALAVAFPGVAFAPEPAGGDIVAHLGERGVELPPALAGALAARPQSEGGEFQGAGFAVRFRWATAEPVMAVEAAAYVGGLYEDDLYEHLERLAGWESELVGSGRVVRGRDAE